jgi:hypothetical protein
VDLFHLNTFGSHKDLLADDVGGSGWMNNIENILSDELAVMVIKVLFLI